SRGLSLIAQGFDQLSMAAHEAYDTVSGVLERSEHASWLNPVIHADTYYIHALSVKPGFRGKRVGYHLIQNAINHARQQGFGKLQLDVLSDNPAVSFYRAVGLELLAETRAPHPSAFGVPPELRMGLKLA
ncbi:MAG: GNAT family N-acetyltransferase, partial [Pseudomonadota bacterium]